MHTTSSDKTGKPSDDDGRATRDLHEGKNREDHHDAEAVDRDALLCGVGENSRGSSFEGERVEGTDGAVRVRIASGKDRGQ
jgi:hypothetical protein